MAYGSGRERVCVQFEYICGHVYVYVFHTSPCGFALFLSFSLSLSLWEFAPSSRPLLGVTVMVSEEVGWPAAAARVARLARCDMRTQRSLHMREIVRACVYTHTHTHKYIFIGRIDKPAQLSAREREKKGGAEPRHKCFSFSLTHTHKLLGS